MKKKEALQFLKKIFLTVGYFVNIGIHLSVTLCICIWLGKKFDAFFGTEPYGLLFGIVVSFPASIYSIYRRVKKILK